MDGPVSVQHRYQDLVYKRGLKQTPPRMCVYVYLVGMDKCRNETRRVRDCQGSQEMFLGCLDV